MSKINMKIESTAFEKLWGLASKEKYFNAGDFYLTKGGISGQACSIITINDKKNIFVTPLNDKSLDILAVDEIAYGEWIDSSVEQGKEYLKKLLQSSSFFK